MTTIARFCLISYHPLIWYIIASKINFISVRKRTVDTHVVNDVSNTRQSVITRMIFMTWRIFDFFSIRAIFISPNEQQKQYFHEWRIPLLVFMSEIKNDLSLKKSNFLFLFFCLKIAII